MINIKFLPEATENDGQIKNENTNVAESSNEY